MKTVYNGQNALYPKAMTGAVRKAAAAIDPSAD
jgi:hypothetical protein